MEDTTGRDDTTGREDTTRRVSTDGRETNGDIPVLYRQQSQPKVHHHKHSPFHGECHFLFKNADALLNH